MCGQASFFEQTGMDVAKDTHEVLSTHQRQMLRHSNRVREVSAWVLECLQQVIKVSEHACDPHRSQPLWKLAVGSVTLVMLSQLLQHVPHLGTLHTGVWSNAPRCDHAGVTQPQCVRDNTQAHTD